MERENLERELSSIPGVFGELERERDGAGQLPVGRCHPRPRQCDPQLEDASGSSGESLGLYQRLLGGREVAEQRRGVGELAEDGRHERQGNIPPLGRGGASRSQCRAVSRSPAGPDNLSAPARPDRVFHRPWLPERPLVPLLRQRLGLVEPSADEISVAQVGGQLQLPPRRRCRLVESARELKAAVRGSDRLIAMAVQKPRGDGHEQSLQDRAVAGAGSLQRVGNLP